MTCLSMTNNLSIRQKPWDNCRCPILWPVKRQIQVQSIAQRTPIYLYHIASKLQISIQYTYKLSIIPLIASTSKSNISIGVFAKPTDTKSTPPLRQLKVSRLLRLTHALKLPELPGSRMLPRNAGAPVYGPSWSKSLQFHQGFWFEHVRAIVHRLSNPTNNWGPPGRNTGETMGICSELSAI